MERHEKAIMFVLEKEGGYQAHPEDTGNYNSKGELVGTNFGISAKVYEKYIGRVPGEDDIRNMPIAHAIEIYKKRYWDPVGGDLIKSYSVALAMFDWFVNAGRPAIMSMQKVLRIRQDGIVGKQTIHHINQYEPEWLFNAYKKERIEWYKRLVDRKPRLLKFFRGWMNRINSITFQD